jgi:hypothetical protein
LFAAAASAGCHVWRFENSNNPPADARLIDVIVDAGAAHDASAEHDGCVPADELCNDRDDNCNGEVDELYADKNKPCEAGVGLCRRAGQLRCRPDGRGLACDAVAGPAGVEACDSDFEDEDCNGKSNEGCACSAGTADRPCLPHAGFCQPGAQKCVDGAWTDCQGAVASPDESCNGKDDNCDGRVDEGFDVGRACLVLSDGCRRYGTTVCAPGGDAVVCDATVADIRPETCNGLDDDCNGVVDDVTGPCGVSGGTCRPGTRACSGGKEICMGAVLPSDELCNELDDNCNDEVDELYADKGHSCDVGLGACRRTGTFVCRADGHGLACDATPGQPEAEACDAAFVDENCDGRSNEGCACSDGEADRPCPPRPGVCNPGAQKCQGGRWSDCLGGDVGPPEICNGRDDNCDGVADEGFGIGQSCLVETAGCRRYGTTVCAPDGATVVCDATIADVRPETCNGLDDDCDGVIDDVTGPCGVSGGACRPGTRACSGGQEICVGAVAPTTERCNDVDDDCNGQVDEVFDVGAACADGVGECRRTGTRICAPDGVGTVCSVMAAPPQPEQCNDRDDDCDGVPDYTVNSDGTLSSACGCDRQPVTPAQGVADRFEQAASPSLCPVTGGTATMQYFQGVCANPYPFSQCLFTSVDLTDFDADHGGLGALEISFTLAQTTYSEVNFYYGLYPRRKLLRPFSFDQARGGIGPGCYRVVFAPSDAICPTYSTADLATPAFAGFDRACITGCTAGRWADRNPACAFSYANTTLYVTVEGCARDGQTGSIGDIEIRRHGTSLGPNCLCAPGQGCKDLAKPICDTRAALPAPTCPAGVRCGGICVTDAERDRACLYDPAEVQ